MAGRVADREAALRAYVAAGTIKGAAHQLGISERAVRKRLAAYCEANGYVSVVQAVFRFGTAERGPDR